MSRFIDEEWLKIALELYRAVDLSEAPSIDIVRCGECKYCKTYYHSYDSIPSRCLRTLNEVNADDFCSYGERSSRC